MIFFFAGIGIGILIGIIFMSLMSMAGGNTIDQETLDQARAAYERCLTRPEKERERHATL